MGRLWWRWALTGRCWIKSTSNVVEVKARGAEVLAVTTDEFRGKMEKTADAVIAVPESHPVVQPSLGVVPLQLFAYYVALQRAAISTSRAILPKASQWNDGIRLIQPARGLLPCCGSVFCGSVLAGAERLNEGGKHDKILWNRIEQMTRE